MTTLRFTVPGEVRGKGRPRVTARAGFARTYTDAKTASYENLVRLSAREALASAAPLDGPVALTCIARLTPPVSASRKAREAMLAGRQFPTRKPDLDNVLKALLDGLNAVAFRDDVLVVRLSAEKVWAEAAGLDVTVEPVVAT